MKRIEEILKRLVRINTTNPPGREMDMVDEILRLFPERTNHTIVDHGNGRGSLIVEVNGKTKNKIGFIGHLDTVPVQDGSSWIYDPFEGVIQKGYLYGRGASDMKGGITAMILTALHFIERRISPLNTIDFVFTADEESGGIGIQALRDQGFLNDISRVFIPEPSDEQIGICEKGALWLSIRVKGKSAHSSKPELGLNAIDMLFEYIRRLKQTLDLESEHSLLGKSSCAVTLIRGGVKTNIIPEDALASLDIRTVPGFDHGKTITDAHRIAIEMENECKGLAIELEVENNRPALHIDEDNGFIRDIVSAYRRLGYPVNVKGVAFYTDASQLIPFQDIPFVILGPGKEEMCHQKNERINLESIRRMVDVYISYISNC